ncbi:protein of unknown function (plasmid) [Cupriavidus taiwanensis]|uniref:Uncharacterized protein n=1 Tax=Cupriavidus taiwanensis TaxID=164546 RepID=A0A375HF61_9BURK|nr:hypothetical protein CBM2588_B20093 [Cupriavidus taiwanensis]SOY69946.1 hypothetical protein CBM2592_B20094 [Cupriavidus taiwanensis]SOY92312.1 hypothetical protein CBM2591_B10385 [Cupriavidus taiwanensis]SOZ29468.1 hypothetical protein CBM2608_B20095 [Cupriavidus taiwanensis]SOZ74078.1 hypothetical protein CBM2617_B30067 [Cupriavidus taiwanensis]
MEAIGAAGPIGTLAGPTYIEVKT